MEGHGKVPLFGQGREAHGQGTVHREHKRPDRPQHEALPGRVHDIRVYRMKHPTFPSGLPFRTGLTARRGRQGCVSVWTGATRGVQKMYEEVEVLAPIRRKPGKKLSALEKRVQQAAFKDPLLRGARHPQGQDLADNERGVPEPAEEVRPDQRHRVRIGKPKVVVAGRTGSLTETNLKSRVGRLEK